MDPYRALGVPSNCTREELKEAFRAKVVSAHPDLGGDESRFIELRTAYDRALAALERREKRARSIAARSPGQTVDPSVQSPVERKSRKRSRNRRHRRSWFGRVSAKWHNDRRGWWQILGPTLILFIILSIPIGGLFALTYVLLDIDGSFARAGQPDHGVDRYFAIASVLTSFLLACWIVWYYGEA
jgi:DnaJ domain